MKKVQIQGVHHITIVGSTKQSAVDFWQGALGMPFVFEQPNLGKPDENHLYFDPGDGRLLTVFTNESREDARRHAPREIGCVEHLAFNVSRATFAQAPDRLRARGIEFIQRAPQLHVSGQILRCRILDGSITDPNSLEQYTLLINQQQELGSDLLGRRRTGRSGGISRG